MTWQHVFEAQNVVAEYEHPVPPETLEDFHDFDHPCNAPAKDPAANLDYLKFHSSFDHFVFAMPVQTVSVNHLAVAGRTVVDTSVYDIPVTNTGQIVAREITLVNHGLPYVPDFRVAYNSALLSTGQMVQDEGDGRSRIVCPFADSTKIGLLDLGNATDVGLSAVTRTYQVMIFKQPAIDPDLRAFELMGDGGVAFARGKVRSSDKHLRRVLAGESSFDFNRGPTLDVLDGRMRIVSGGVAYTESGYPGSFAGPDFIPLGGF